MGIIENERAQFMLLAGFIIAIGLVIATVMLNNIIFESNMAGEAGGDPIKYDLVNLMRISGDEIKSAYRNVTAPGQNPALKFSNFTKQMQNFNENLSIIYALHGECVNLSWDISNWNTTRYANFTENGTANGARNWTVIENVKDSNITVNVTTISPPFNISINSSTKSWQINFTAPQNITINSAQIIANVSVTPYTISFINGANVSGRFNITGNTSNNKSFIRARDYILNATILFSTSDTRANITIPVSVPW
ncbi:MAG: hypothetical protein MPEBLZ_01086 [Candidatus Methanoperedens nitroreducens]|uniref:Uncharacterized protein n=1 Tax=Candidatus Methanoperedens nitratireducens TaxID=1392998 RepID=A0A0N8KR97_9EURY|nr:hypothetical protein [Candidatus Methanoperedens sp. BLZ2]KAB2948362.1 MAG: hypothetical protein F9K14_00580 [Candidatus Methanoperedens sp.]KPQ44330.1 MAG: hypothetical protein MPEBLZ_01086 [Candidatus Methanoperedens sp. BLZ1]MBZ0174553.1 hypothetical protein [Candidatus Methanoperedens nitroreducens]MCX9078578.1 hypothetical protein [Candidatus Methanoperedens sp.]